MGDTFIFILLHINNHVYPIRLAHSIAWKQIRGSAYTQGVRRIIQINNTRRWGSWGHLKSICHSKFLFHYFTLHYLPYSPIRPPYRRLKTPNMICGPFFLVVGLKLNSVDPTMSIDLKYLGVQLPLAPATSFPFWNLTGTNPASPGECIAFMKSNKFVNINEKLPLLETKYVSDSLG